MCEKDDWLGLSLSLSTQPSLKMNLMQRPSQPMQYLHRKINSSNNGLFARLSEPNSDTRLVLGGTDMTRAATMGECEEENVVSSTNSTISSVSGKRGEGEAVGEEIEAERDSCSPESDEEDGAGGDDASRKKLRLSKEQSLVLEETFKEYSSLNPKQKQALAKQLNLRPRQVEVWFQNRRARTKLKQTEVDCEYLKRCCERLTEENRRLQKEVQELRALKLSPQLYMHMNPPTTLTMCPQCERVSSSSPSTASSAASVLAPIVPNRSPMGHDIRRPIPINARAKLSIHRRPLNAPMPQS